MSSLENEEEREGEEENEIDYLKFAEDLKDKGNKAFQEGDYQQSISFFTQAIEIDPDNHVYYSNRAAAYFKVDSISKALRDSEKCVELAPKWPKGYNRLGTAQMSLRRFDDAFETIKKGLELDPDNKALWETYTKCQEVYEKDKNERHHKAALEREKIERMKQKQFEANQELLRRQEKEKQEELLSDFLSDVKASTDKDESTKSVHEAPSSSGVEENIANGDDLLAGFFNEITESTEQIKSKPKKRPFSDGDQSTAEVDEPGDADRKENTTLLERDESLLTEKYVAQDLGDGASQCERIMGKHYQWRNLNPYYVLQLDTDATEEDIRQRYKKLSLKIHPDRLRTVDTARDAFEQVKEAYNKLMDPDQKKTIKAHIEAVTEELRKERNRKVRKGMNEKEMLPFEEERKRILMKHFAEIERMRIRSETNRRAYNARDRMQEEKEQERMAKFEEFEKDWSEENRRENRVGNWRDFSTTGTAPKKPKVHSFKEESRDSKKFGKVEVESWKKNWR